MSPGPAAHREGDLRDAGDPVVEDLRQRLLESRPIQGIFERQHGDGRWDERPEARDGYS